MRQIYLDYNASTPIAPEVAAVMRDAMEDAYGNPSSGHWAGPPARELVETARSQVAELLGCAPEEIVFTSGGSEANNLALKGIFFSSKRPRRHFITTRVEHPAITAPLRFLQRLGAAVTWLPVDGTGRIDPDDLRRAITSDTILISIMHANNEVGTIQPIDECAAIAREHGIPFHSDAAQSAGKIPARVDDLGVDLLSIAGHKLYAPNRKWAGDISYIWTSEGWLYLAVILDLHSRRAIGWAIGSRMKKDLAIRALDMAQALRKPLQGCIFHSDRGSQYCSHDDQKKLRKYGLTPSMSGKGDCYDNASVESFFKTIKAELIWRKSWPTRRHAETATFQYINGFYNPRRRHSYLGGISPLAFERKAA